jgi:hypothetical protein
MNFGGAINYHLFERVTDGSLNPRDLERCGDEVGVEEPKGRTNITII